VFFKCRRKCAIHKTITEDGESEVSRLLSNYAPEGTKLEFLLDLCDEVYITVYFPEQISSAEDQIRIPEGDYENLLKKMKYSVNRGLRLS
jgi:hypothetical protein